MWTVFGDLRSRLSVEPCSEDDYDISAFTVIADYIFPGN